MPALRNAKHERFCQEYVIDLNATQAYIRAGYSEKGAGQSAERLLRNAEIRARIAELQAGLAKRLEITQAKVAAELAKLGFSNMDDFVRRTPEGEIYTNFSGVDRDKMAAVQEVTVETYTEGRGDDAKDVKRVRFKLADKRGALVDLGKHLGMWPQKSEVNVNVFEHMNADEQRALRDALEALARDKGEDADGAEPTHQ